MSPTQDEVRPLSTLPAGLGPYALLFTLQTVGVAIVFINALPVYRELARDFERHQPQPGILWWAVGAVMLIQAAYWLAMRRPVPRPQRGHIVLSHLTAFAARLAFILASSTFAVMFLVRYDQLNLSLPRIAVVLVMLFSLFCYTQELERLAKALRGPEGGAA